MTPSPTLAPSSAPLERLEVDGYRYRTDARASATRAGAFGVSDALVTNVLLTLGIVGAHGTPGVVRLASLAALVAGACPMASGEYLSTRAQRELLGRELEVERLAHQRDPEGERLELAQLHPSPGLPAGPADQLAAAVMRDPDIALAVRARKELGLDVGHLGSPLHAASTSMVCFALGASLALPLWFFATGAEAVALVVARGVVVAAGLAVALPALTGRSALRLVVCQVVLSGLAVAVIYAVARVAGMGGDGVMVDGPRSSPRALDAKPGVRRLRFDIGARPFLVLFELTRACDLACWHCRAESVSERYPAS